ncbi:MAG: formylglycine-generating enzyme family protein [Candidatus Ratteibacteria bacterium]|jgi:formylglycine-generating enzyme required for sulfatase activity
MRVKKYAVPVISILFSLRLVIPAVSAPKTMVLIPAGEFTMGSPRNEGYADEYPQHKIFLSAYYIDKREVTVAQYRKFCRATKREMPPVPYWGWQNSHPIINVTWDDAVAYAQYYDKRLPTEAEWEKAARAGSTAKYCFGDSETNLGNYAWYSANANRQTHPVGTKKPNAFGLYDMHGNVWEWCSDWYDANYYSNSPTDNPKGPANGQFRVLRGGGCWLFALASCRSAVRGWFIPSNGSAHSGFRCASSP